MIIDSHCHLNYEPMSLNLKDTIERANKDGVNYLSQSQLKIKALIKFSKLYPITIVFMVLMEFIRMKLKSSFHKIKRYH